MTEAPAKVLPPPSPGARPPHGKDDDAIERRTLRDYYIILRERLWVALPLALTAAIGLALYQSRELPQYRATASMRFDKQDIVLRDKIDVTNTQVSSDSDLTTYLTLITSGRIRTLVQEKITPEQLKILQRPYLTPGGTPPPVSALISQPDISSQHANLIVKLSVIHRDPEAAMILANLYVEQFIYYLGNEAGDKNDTTAKTLATHVENLQKKSRESEQALQKFMSDNSLGSNLDANDNIVRENLAKANSALTSARLERGNYEDQLHLIERYQAEKRDLLEISSIASSGNIHSLRDARDALIREQTKLIDHGYDYKWPALIAATDALAVAQKQLDDAIQLAIADLRSTIEKFRANEITFQAEVTAQEKNMQSLRELGITYKRLAAEADIDSKNYKDVLSRLNEVQLVKRIAPVPVSLLDAAQRPSAPFTPDPSRITKTAIGVGLLVFLGVAIGLSFVDDRIKSAWDVETFIGSTLLGIIPDLGNLKDTDKYRLALGESQGAGTEPFLGLYSSVKIHSKLDFPKSILVTSTVPGEGKTLVSCNLAGSFARHGRRTLIIDCDLRRPMLHRHFEKPNDTGLIAWFENGASLDEGLLTNPHLGITSIGENLSLITAGGRSKSPTQFLESVAFAQLVERLKKHFELIVIDSPPMGAVTDALLIADRADEILYVCRFNRAFRKHIRLYIKALRHSKNEILGIVLNGLSPRRIEYYSNYRYYRSYKKYYGAQG